MSDLSNKRTIEYVLNKDDGSTIYADTFFLKSENELFNYRNELQKAIKGIRVPLFTCYFCGQNIKINGGGQTMKVLHFAHKKDSDLCPIKTNTKFTKGEITGIKYNGAKESVLHFKTKNLIKGFLELNNDFSEIKVEKVVKSNTNYLEWKKPDISTIYKNANVVFEIQLSTTFLSVIVDREFFYKENQTYILWVFKNFEIEEFKQRFTEKDVFYSNNRNAFVLDDEAINLSKQKNDLYLLCYYQKPYIENLKIKYYWGFEYICFNQLTFDEVNYKIFYFDVNKEEEKVYNEILATEKELREKEFIKQQKAKEEVLKLQLERTKEIKYDCEDYNYSYYENESENETPVIDYTAQKIRERNIHFDECNRDIRVNLRNEFLVTNYQGLFLKEHNEIYDKIFDFFKTQYTFSEQDKKFIKSVFESKLPTNERLNEDTIIYYISISLFLNKLSDFKELYSSYNSNIQQHLFAILSIRKRRVIGYNYSNIIQIVNLYANSKNPKAIYFDLIYKAIETYYGVEEFCKMEDKKGLLKSKILNSNNWKPEQETKYNEIVSIVFPEIKF